MTLKKWLTALALTLVFIPSLARGQGSTATAAGVVRDEQNLVVPGAAVTVAGTENKFHPDDDDGP